MPVAACLIGGMENGGARTNTQMGLPMASARAWTHASPQEHWHTIQVSPAPGTPKTKLRDKLNPVWWLLNADDPIPPAWYRPTDKHRGFKWRFRNPFHNFDHYVIGVADRKFSRSGRFPELNSNPNGGWDFEFGRCGQFILLPFISYQRPGCAFYLGWREHGAFGVKFNLHFSGK